MKHPFTKKFLGEILLSKGLINQKQLEKALEQSQGHIGERLVRNQFATSEQVAEGLAEQFHMPYVNLQSHTIPSEMFEHLSATDSYRLGVLPYRVNGKGLEIVISDPLNLHEVEDQLERICGTKVTLLMGSQEAIKGALERSHAISALLQDISVDFKQEKGEETVKSSVSAETVHEDAGSIIKLINTILLAALQKRASDVHIETYESGTVIKYRIDGLLYPATEKLDFKHHKSLVSRVKVMAELDISETRIPQDGRFKLRLNGKDIDFRVSVLPSVFGEDVVIRILDKTALNEAFSQLSLDSLGFSAETLKKFRRSIREPYGMVLITGPTGSGKTTSLYAALNEINDGEEKIITIEDPVEYQLNGIVQIPVNEKKGLNFAKGLRSILRHDPDKIMVGEIRDMETAQIAVQSALTGHLVFTTVHANNAVDVIGRFNHMGVNIYSFVSALNCVMAQRLMRMICPHCKSEEKISAEVLSASGLDPATYSKEVWYAGKGCDHCSRTGYRGRMAVAEFLDLTPAIREMIVDKKPLDDIQKAAMKDGMVPLRKAALEKALKGETTLKEVNRVTFVD